jgi:hypothetical protein
MINVNLDAWEKLRWAEEALDRSTVIEQRDDHPSRGQHSGGRSGYPDHRRHSLMQSAHADRVVGCKIAAAGLSLSTFDHCRIRICRGGRVHSLRVG